MQGNLKQAKRLRLEAARLDRLVSKLDYARAHYIRAVKRFRSSLKGQDPETANHYLDAAGLPAVELRPKE